MKHWKINYSVRNADEVTEKELFLEAPNIEEALREGRQRLEQTPDPDFVIWDVGIMEDDVF